MALKDLAHFTIRSIELKGPEHALVRGDFDHLKAVRLDEADRTVGFLFRERETSIYLFFAKAEHFDPGSKVATFTAYLTPPALRVGESLPYVDRYWTPKQVAFGLEPLSRWKKIRFQPVDMVRFHDPKAPGWWKAHAASGPVMEAASDVHVVKNGWDHEHCHFCWAHIGKGAGRFGYYSKTDDDWLCVRCYERFVARHDLSYLQFKK